jgi:hypothetical protein
MSPSPIESFLTSVRGRIHSGLLRTVTSRVLLGAAISAVLYALAWRVFGYAAPRIGYVAIALTAVLVAIAWLVSKRRDLRHAAGVADRFFELKDGLVSWMDFKSAGLQGEVYQLRFLFQNRRRF